MARKFKKIIGRDSEKIGEKLDLAGCLVIGIHKDGKFTASSYGDTPINGRFMEMMLEDMGSLMERGRIRVPPVWQEKKK